MLASISPGMTYFPRASILLAVLEMATLPKEPTAEILPSVITSTPLVTGALPVPSMMVAPVIASVSARAAIEQTARAGSRVQHAPVRRIRFYSCRGWISPDCPTGASRINHGGSYLDVTSGREQLSRMLPH